MNSLFKKVLLFEAKLIAFAADRVHHLAHNYIQQEVEHSAGYEEFVTQVRDTVESAEQKLAAPVRWALAVPSQLVKSLRRTSSNNRGDVERLHERLNQMRKATTRAAQNE